MSTQALTKEEMKERITRVEEYLKEHPDQSKIQACKALNLSWTGYYSWKRRLKGQPVRKKESLKPTPIEKIASAGPIKVIKKNKIAQPVGANRMFLLVGSTPEVLQVLRSFG